MESASVSDFDRLAFGLLVKTSFLPYLIELCLIGNFLLATPLTSFLEMKGGVSGQLHN